MFAVIKTGGKQFKVKSADVIAVEKLAGKAGDTVSFDVLSVGSDKDVAVGAPTVAGAKVSGLILEQGKGDKVVIFKKKRRQNYRRRNGHRQELTYVRIAEIVDAKGNKDTAPALKAQPKKKEAAPKAAAKPAVKKAAAPKAEKKPAAEKKAAPAKKPAAKKPAAKKA